MTSADKTLAFNEYEQYDAMGLAELVRQKRVSPQELLDATIERIEARDPSINAAVTRMYDQARAAITAGLPAGPFSGVPFMLKDLGAHYAGVRTSNGGRIFAEFVPDHDTTLVERHKAAGLAIMGKTNTPELEIAATTEPQLFGPTRNPGLKPPRAGRRDGCRQMGQRRPLTDGPRHAALLADQGRACIRFESLTGRERVSTLVPCQPGCARPRFSASKPPTSSWRWTWPRACRPSPR